MATVFESFYILLLILWTLAFFLGAYLLRRRKWISNFALTAGMVLFVLLAAEFIYRWFFKPESPGVGVELGCGAMCYRGDSLLGFKPGIPGKWDMRALAPGADTVIYTEYIIMKDTVQRGIEYDHRVGYRADSSGKEVVFFGCSFTFGTNVPDSSTLPYQFGMLKNVSSVNLGCAAYGLHQVYGVYDNKFADQDNRSRVFVYSMLSDHFYRANGVYDWNLDGPYYKLQNDSLVHAGPVRWNINMRFRRAPFYLSFFNSLSLIKDKLEDITLRRRMNAFNKQDYDRILLMLQHMSRSIAATGGKLIIVNWDRSNWGYQGYEFPYQKELDNDVSKLGVEVIPVSSIINYNDTTNFIPNDGHPTALANYHIAKALANKFP
jgi:hypothetical protein